MITVHYRQGRVESDFAYEHKSYFIIAFIYQLQKSIQFVFLFIILRLYSLSFCLFKGRIVLKKYKFL